MIFLEAGTTGTVVATIAAFLLVILLLVALLLFVKQKLSHPYLAYSTSHNQRKPYQTLVYCLF